MWLGVLIGLVAGAAFGSLSAALTFAVIGGAVGALMSREMDAASRRATGADGVPPDDLPRDDLPSDLRSALRALQEQMRLANRRIDLLETRLREAGIVPEAAAQPQAAPDVAISARAASEERAPAAAVVDKDKSPEQAPPAAARTEPRPAVSPAQERPASAAGASAAVSDSRPARRPAETSAAYRSAEPETPQAPEIPAWLSEFVARWITGGNPIVKVGVLILFLGLAFLLRYVAEHTVVPIEYRYAGVAAAGIGLLLLGWRLRNKEDSYGLILQGAGVGVLYLTTLAGMKLHPLIPAEAGFAILIGVAVFAVLLALLQDSLAMAAAAALGGFAAPVLASTGSENHVAFFSYLTLLNLGVVAIAWFKTWRTLNLIGFVCTFFLAVGWGEQYYQPPLFNIAEPFLLLFFVLYVLIAFLFARRTLAEAEIPAPSGDVSFEDHVLQAAPQVSYVDGSLVFGAPLATFSMQYLIVRSFENGPAFSALGFGLAYIFLAYALFRRTGLPYALLSETMIALAVIFGSLAVPLGLEGKWTSAAWAVEAAGVYWVGIRQQRVHARMFALLLLLGSTTYFVLDLAPGSGAAVLDGSWLGSVMLALSTWWFYRLVWAAPAGSLHAFEHRLRPWLAAGGCLFVALTPFLLWPMNWASTLLAILGAAAVFAARPLKERGLIGWGCAYQVLAGGLYLTTVHPAYDGAALADSWRGMLTAGMIGVSLLAAAWASLQRSEAEEQEQEEGVRWLLALVLLGGLSFVNMALLFVLPWRFAAMIWPMTGLVTLWWALRARQHAALAFALGLQLIAGAVSLGSRLSLFDGPPGLSDARAFLHSGFWSPALIALAAFAAARLLHRREGERSSIALGWGALSWSAVWWSFAWTAEFDRLLPPMTAVSCLVGVTVVTAGLWRTLAQRLDWRQLGQATLAYLPALAILFSYQMDHPLAQWGALLWPAALAMHVVLLRDQKDWLTPELHSAVHVAGAWLFVAIATLETHFQLESWSAGQGAWSTLGWLIVPLAYLWAVSSEPLRGKWPLCEFRDAYAVTAAAPIAAFALGWAWLSALMEGSPAPLPYLPVLNPLEVGQIAVLMGIALWWRSLEQPVFRENNAVLAAGLGATAFMVISNMVLRACHQWGDIPWNTEALLNSMVVQTSLSIVWGVIAIGLMLFGHGKGVRWVWITGAALVAGVVGKLFFVELAAHGSLERIVSFIVVGLLLLLVGYFAPLPPRQDAEPGEDLEQPTASEAP